MRGTARAAGALAAAVLLVTGCGSARHQAARGPDGSTTARQPGTATARQPGTATITRPQAERLARQLLSRAALPPGARRRGGPPPRALAGPAPAASGRPAVRLHELWAIAQPMNAVYAFARKHTPAGLARGGSGQSGYAADHATAGVHSLRKYIPAAMPRSGSPPVRDLTIVTQEFVSYQLSPLPAGVSAASLTISVAPAGPDASVVRADAQVIWYPPRPAAEHVPAGMHAVTITASFLDREVRRVTRAFTSPAVVGPLTAMLNDAHASPGGITNCPLQQVTYTLAFARSRGAVPSLVAADTGCMILRVRVPGHDEPALQEPLALKAMLARLIYSRGTPGIGAALPG